MKWLMVGRPSKWPPQHIQKIHPHARSDMASSEDHVVLVLEDSFFVSFSSHPV